MLSFFFCFFRASDVMESETAGLLSFLSLGVGRTVYKYGGCRTCAVLGRCCLLHALLCSALAAAVPTGWPLNPRLGGWLHGELMLMLIKKAT